MRYFMDNYACGDDNKRKKRRFVVIFFLIILSAAVIVGVVLFSLGPDKAKPAVEIDPNAGDWGMDYDFGEKFNKDGIQIPGRKSVYIEKNKRNVKMDLANPKDNKCYFYFKVILDDTAETIYESKAVPPGQSIRSVNLTRPLPEGEYSAVIDVSTVSLDGTTPLNGARTRLSLIVK